MFKFREQAVSPTISVEEIHETFYTEVDRLLADAQNQIPMETDKQTILDKGKILQSLGFEKSIETKKAIEEKQKIDHIIRENDEKDRLARTISYFSFHYPNYKFITEESVKKICRKYGLVYGPVGEYLGTVPDRNLKHIKDFTLRGTDACYMSYSTFSGGTIVPSSVKYVPLSGAQMLISGAQMSMGFTSSHHVDLCSLEIVAPVSDFDMSESKIKNFKLLKVPVPIPDPVVLQPVHFEGQKHYLIITAWGPESKDDLVVNPINN